MVRRPDLCPSPVQEYALGPAGPEIFHCVRHQMQNAGLIVLPGQEHRQHEQAPEGGQLPASPIIAAGPAARPAG
jgi:hypothetical protein